MWVIGGVSHDKPSVNGGCFGYAIHDERNMTILFFLLPTHFIIGFELRSHEFENGSQSIGLRQIKVGRLTSFQFGDLAFYLACLSCENGVGYACPYSCEFGQV